MQDEKMGAARGGYIAKNKREERCAGYVERCIECLYVSVCERVSDNRRIKIFLMVRARERVEKEDEARVFRESESRAPLDSGLAKTG